MDMDLGIEPETLNRCTFINIYVTIRTGCEGLTIESFTPKSKTEKKFLSIK